MDPQDGRVVSNFVTRAVAGKELEIYGNGKQTRSFCYISDLLSAIVKVAEMENFVGPINLGNDQEFTINELAALLQDLMQKKLQLSYKELPKDDPKVRKPNLDKTQELLGWHAQTELREGLIKTIEYFSKN